MPDSSPRPPKRFAQIIRLRPAHAAEYMRLHAAVWPAILQRIRECGIRDYSIFYDESRPQGEDPAEEEEGDGGTGLLFASFKYVVRLTLPYFPLGLKILGGFGADEWLMGVDLGR